MIKVGIFGGTGYMGGEALRILLEHPQAEVVWVTSCLGNTLNKSLSIKRANPGF